MTNEISMDIDYEKLRKHLVKREFLTGLVAATHANLANCVNASEATPEQLISIARRYNVNLDRFKVKN